MAYFANSSEGATLDEQCEDCFFVCPVYSVQMLFNYEQHDAGQEKLKSCLRILIDDDGICQMKKAMGKEKTDAVEILHRRYIGDDAERKASLQEERNKWKRKINNGGNTQRIKKSN